MYRKATTSKDITCTVGIALYFVRDTSKCINSNALSSIRQLFLGPKARTNILQYVERNDRQGFVIFSRKETTWEQAVLSAAEKICIKLEGDRCLERRLKAFKHPTMLLTIIGGPRAKGDMNTLEHPCMTRFQ
jgi:hypothetical protein